jgi:serine/threonine protein kinase
MDRHTLIRYARRAREGESLDALAKELSERLESGGGVAAGPAATVAHFGLDDDLSNPGSPQELVDSVSFGYVDDPELFATVLEKAAETAPVLRYDDSGKTGVVGSADVHAAIDLEHDREVALVFPRTTKPDAAALAAFVERATAVGELTHASIPDVYDAGAHEADGRPFYVTQRVSGVGLDDELAQVAETGEHIADTTVEVILEACAIVGAAHSQGVVHGALNPTAIRRTPSTVIVDWGIAGVLDGPPNPAFVAPEVLAGDRPGVEADVYAFGAMLYELAVLEPMFSGDTIPDDVRLGRFTAPSDVWSGIPLNLEAVIVQATASSPIERYESLAEFVDAVRSWQESANQPTSELAVRSGLPPVWLGVLAFLLVALVGVVGLIILLVTM